jgi:hypothetical protein
VPGIIAEVHARLIAGRSPEFMKAECTEFSVGDTDHPIKSMGASIRPDGTVSSPTLSGY